LENKIIATFIKLIPTEIDNNQSAFQMWINYLWSEAIHHWRPLAEQESKTLSLSEWFASLWYNVDIRRTTLGS